MRKLCLLWCMLCLGGCVSQSIHPNMLVVGAKSYRLPVFTRVHVVGHFNVELRTQRQAHQVRIQGVAGVLPLVEAKVNQGTLFVSCMNCQNMPVVQLRIETQRLQAFYFEGAGDLIGKALHAPVLDLAIDNRGTTVLGGYLGLKTVTIKGGGRVTLTGVKSRHLELVIRDHSRVQLAGDIRLGGLVLENGSWVSLYWLMVDQLQLKAHGDTVVQMAGKARKIEVELWDHAQFRGRHFRANETYVKTHHHAIAEINTIEHQHVLATDSSDVYFYRVPDDKANFMADNGSVLDMQMF